MGTRRCPRNKFYISLILVVFLSQQSFAGNIFENARKKITENNKFVNKKVLRKIVKKKS